MEYLFYLLVLVCLYSVLTMTANLLLGYLGILYLAHPAIYGIGAYIFALLVFTDKAGFWTAMIAAGLGSGLAAFLLSLPALRLRSHYIGMTTMAFLVIVNGLLLNLRDVTRGALGIPGIPRPTIFGTTLQTNGQFLIFALVFTTVIGFILYRIVHSPFGNTIEAIREDETAAQTLGKNTIKIKIQTFVITGIIAGLTGAILSSFLAYINPWSFSFDELIRVLAMVIIGGMGSFWGSLAGAAIIVFLPEPLRLIDIDAEQLGAVRLGIYGLIIILVMLLRPFGLFGKRTNTFSK